MRLYRIAIECLGHVYHTQILAKDQAAAVDVAIALYPQADRIYPDHACLTHKPQPATTESQS